jgi:hypothetical protein
VRHEKANTRRRNIKIFAVFLENGEKCLPYIFVETLWAPFQSDRDTTLETSFKVVCF